MKFSSKETRLSSSSKSIEVSIGLADQKKAIELLYSQYSNPIQTCVQELVSNCFDAHVDANKQHVPILIKLPTVANNYHISFRDYGNSMSDEVMKTVYLQVNATTKAGSNKSLGGFGIGSKTPWAYTDTFILKTFLDGVETHYLLIRGRSTVVVAYKGETTEPNGTEVVFKTKPHDAERFQKAVQRISLCAKVKPIVTPKTKLFFDEEVELSNWTRFIRSDLLRYDNGVYINLGGVLYKITRNLIPTQNYYGNSRDTVVEKITKLLKSCSLVIDLKVGTVMPLQTREALFTQGDEGQANKVVMKKILAKVWDQLESYIEEKKKSVKCPVTAHDFYKDDMLTLKDVFTFGNLSVSSTGFTLNKGSITLVTRKSKTWSGKNEKGRREEHQWLKFDDLRTDFYYNELVSSKARIVSRFHGINKWNDVYILCKEKLEPEEYEFLKNYTNAKSIEVVPLVKREYSRSKVDKEKIVYYDAGGRRLSSFQVDKGPYKKTVVCERDGTMVHTMEDYEKLGYEVIFVANGKYKKAITAPNTFTEEEAYDLEKLKEMYVSKVARDCAIKVSRSYSNLRFFSEAVGGTKKELFNDFKNAPKHNISQDAKKDIYKKYGRSIDREIQKEIKKRVRLTKLVDKAPLLRHIKDALFLQGQAKQDLINYVQSSVGRL